MPAPPTTTLLLAAIALALLFPSGAEIVGTILVALALVYEASVFYLLGRGDTEDGR